jgi:poly(A) polymerase
LAVKQAEIYTKDEHKISANDIDPDALKIIRRLHASGHSAYVVGGAVRDLILGNKPKDFDIATDAAPSRIRKLFRNSRIIGRRFRLVHIFFGDKLVEVSTFRAENSGGFMNVYGEIEEDVKRRDFTINALYYNPEDGTVLDYTGGIRDVRNRRLRPVIPLKQLFSEDPVRMIRAIKYGVSGDLKMGFSLKRQLKRTVAALAETPASRMTEELFKILASGRASRIFEQCELYGMLKHMLPAADSLIRENRTFREEFYRTMGLLDELVQAGEARKQRLVAYLCAVYLYTVSPVGTVERISFTDAFADLKLFIRPMVPANRDVEQALVHLIRRRKVYRKFGTLERPDGVEEEEAPHRPKPRRRKRRRPGKVADHENPHNSPEREAPRGLTEND